jgi:hypothetical protein
VRHQEDRYQTAVERMLLTDQYVDTSWDDSMKLMSFCSPAAHSPFRITLQRQEECSRLGRMLNSHGLRDVTRLEVVPLPDTSEFTDADSRAIADVFRDHIQSFNRAVLEFNQKHFDTFDGSETAYLSIVIPILGFAFGLGIARRALDLINDWRS